MKEKNTLTPASLAVSSRQVSQDPRMWTPASSLVGTRERRCVLPLDPRFSVPVSPSRPPYLTPGRYAVADPVHRTQSHPPQSGRSGVHDCFESHFTSGPHRSQPGLCGLELLAQLRQNRLLAVHQPHCSKRLYHAVEKKQQGVPPARTWSRRPRKRKE